MIQDGPASVATLKHASLASTIFMLERMCHARKQNFRAIFAANGMAVVVMVVVNVGGGGEDGGVNKQTAAFQQQHQPAYKIP